MDENPSNAVGPVSPPPPIVLTERQKELCARLDRLWGMVVKKHGNRPSELFKGALYAMQEWNRENPEWMPQAAHSLRDIVWPIAASSGYAEVKKEEALETYGSAGDTKTLYREVNTYCGFFTSVAHHLWEQAESHPLVRNTDGTSRKITPEIFVDMFAGLERALFAASRLQIDAHSEIDKLVKSKSKDAATIRELTELNFDARNYFFSRTDVDWVKWLWEEGLMDGIKEKPKDVTRYSYKTPELEYLSRVAKENPEAATDIILAVESGPGSFNPEVIDRFMWIVRELPAAQLTRIAGKIRDEQWPMLMSGFNRWGFDYEKVLATLAESGDWDSLLSVAAAVLKVRPFDATKERDVTSFSENPFYLSDLEHAKIFERLDSIADTHVLPALELAARSMSGVILAGGKAPHGDIFSVGEVFSLYDVDFFDLAVGDKEHYSFRDDVRDLTAVLKNLAVRALEGAANDEEARAIYEKYIGILPDSRSAWRLRLFLMSRRPKTFEKEILAAFHAVFEHERPFEMLMGTEYESSLRSAWNTFDDSDKRRYVERIIEFFGAAGKDEYYATAGRDILSSIYSGLTDEEKGKAETALGKLNSRYQPQPSIGKSSFGFISHEAPESTSGIGTMDIAQIAAALRGDWSSANLNKETSDLWKRRDAEGVADRLRGDMALRLQAYVDNAPLFFEPGVLEPHYTYSFLRGVVDTIQNARPKGEFDWTGLFTLFDAIIAAAKDKGLADEAKKSEAGMWLAGWKSVHHALADLVHDLVGGRAQNGLAFDFAAHKEKVLPMIDYLLTMPDPTRKDEAEDESRIDPSKKEYTRGSAFDIAINSVRGRAFMALVVYAEHDGNTLPKDVTPRLTEETKERILRTLRAEETEAVMFLPGNYLAFLYFRDPEWFREALHPIMFPEDPTKKDLFIAAWEGYLSRNLYKELFNEMAPLYMRAIAMRPEEYTPRRYHVDLDEGLATHVALAFTHFPEVDYEHPVFRAFWEAHTGKRHEHFISFIGRHSVSSEAGLEPDKVEKIKGFWDWALENCEETEALKAFGYWMKPTGTAFDLPWLAERLRRTLEKTSGNVDWSYGMVQLLPELAKAAPETTLEVVRLYFGVGISKNLNEQSREWLYVDDELVGVFRTLYRNPSTKDATFRLINELLPRAHNRFWQLKQVLEEE